MKKVIIQSWRFSNPLSFVFVIGIIVLFTFCKKYEKQPDCVSPDAHIPTWTQNKFKIQVGDSISFAYTGEDPIGSDFSVKWEFEGGDPEEGYTPNVTVHYNSAGKFSVRCSMVPRCYNNDRPFWTKDPAVTVIP